MLQAMLTFFNKPENQNNATLKTRSGGKACYVRHYFSLNNSAIFSDNSFALKPFARITPSTSIRNVVG